MRKILTIVFLILMCVTVVFGQTIALKAQQEFQGFYQECSNALKRFFYVTSFQ